MGGGGFHPQSLSILTAKYRDKRAFALGVHDSSANLGEVIGPLGAWALAQLRRLAHGAANLGDTRSCNRISLCVFGRRGRSRGKAAQGLWPVIVGRRAWKQDRVRPGCGFDFARHGANGSRRVFAAVSFIRAKTFRGNHRRLYVDFVSVCRCRAGSSRLDFRSIRSQAIDRRLFFFERGDDPRHSLSGFRRDTSVGPWGVGRLYSGRSDPLS